MNVVDENDRPIAHLDADGVAHGFGNRVSVVVTVHGDDEVADYDLPVCTDAFCTRCYFNSTTANPTKETHHMADQTYDPNQGYDGIARDVPNLPGQNMDHGPKVPFKPTVQTTGATEAAAATGAKVQRILNAENIKTSTPEGK